MKIAVFGSSGFIGSALIARSHALGHDSIAYSRRGRPASGAVARQWSLGEIPDLDPCENADGAVHLAHDFDGEAGADRTFRGTLKLIDALRQRGVRRQVFVSSFSAGEHHQSRYGRVKHELEKVLGESEDVWIVRPGLVIGDGGLFGRIAKIARASPVIPLPDGGKGEVYCIDLAELCDLFLRVLQLGPASRVLNLFEPRPRALRDLVLEVAARNRPRLIMNVPSSLALRILDLSERLAIPLPVTSDNLRGFLANQRADHRSSIGELST
ncbi:SDR family oxidoreductase [Pseudomarimonas salicorniae]|uniref:NAD-dependent epimerase/dehydratase family protein n=1 Tax=Pseudomarimonas salicorniae TaxID=2933270 RepID=A0ABT0GIW1_9GAMM|nr:NAD-dependent epimerase/dehydratase family protein [Lysobacter sp. CAU 1642]MCK7594468.1 NAD-dependent epimerase/dehydratase family protein [Lysobacter sp. CAU 1642]